MTIELEHKPGTSEEDIKRKERQVKKQLLAQSFGWSMEELEDNLERIKDFFTQAEKEARKKGTSIIKERPRLESKHNDNKNN